MDKYPNTERANWRNITPEDATSSELNLVHLIMGERPEHITPEQWRDNMRACAKHIREHETGATADKNAKLRKLVKETAHLLVRDCTLHESNPIILKLRAAAQ